METITTTEVVTLPTEVQELAVKVSDQKKSEVNTVLNQIFSGTSDWEKQVDAIEVKGITDVMSIRLADAARKNLKTARLAAEKVFDAKREEVQQMKSEYDLEDKLWLKAKQMMQIKFKAIEEKAEWKARFVERYEAEQKELRTQIRIEKVSKFNPELNRLEFENMSDEMFSIFLSGIEKSFNDKIEAAKKLEEERIAKEKAAEEERQRMIADNERLKAEREAKEKELAEQKAKAEKERKESEAKAAKLKAESDAKIKAEREAKEKIEAELKAKQQAEEKRLKEIADAERKKKEDEAKAAKAPKKQKLNVWIDGLILGAPLGMSDDATVKEIIEKHNSFKSWAKSKIESL
jgi:colicin import membrane protein